MLSKQKQFIEYLSEINTQLKSTALTQQSINKFQIEEKINLIKNQELLIPIIGAFSAGKSSLLNSFIGKRLLPEGITPETALATELRYSTKERIEAINDNNNIETFAITDINKIRDQAFKYKCLKIYLNNDKLLQIQPLILVDMPGFESPLDSHNKAIIEYINKGVHYVVLTSVEDGTITKSMIRQLENIQNYKRDFSFFLSKTNLKSYDEIEEIRLKVQDDLEDNFDKTDNIGLVDNNGGESLKNILLNINPDKLFENLFCESLKDLFFSIKEEINIQISTLSKNKEESEAVIKQLKKALNETIKKRNELIEEAKNKYSSPNTNRIVQAVARDLSSEIESIVSAGISGGQTAISNTINEIVKSSLISNVQDSMKKVCEDVVDSFTDGISDLNASMSNFTSSENWLLDTANSTKKIFDSANRLNNSMNKGNNNSVYKAITSALAITTKVLNPILELVIVFLPEVLNLISSLFGPSKEEKQRNELRSSIATNTIPAIKRELRKKVPNIFNEQINQVINDIANQFELKIQQNKESVEIAQKERDEKNIDIEKTIANYNLVKDSITTLTNNTLN